MVYIVELIKVPPFIKKKLGWWMGNLIIKWDRWSFHNIAFLEYLNPLL